MDAHPILEHGNLTEFTAFIKTAVVPGTAEHTELYWYLLEIFTEYDTDKDGNITMRSFPKMVDVLVELPTKLGMKHEDLMFQQDKRTELEYQEKLFKQYNTRGDGLMSWDEWLHLAIEVVFKKML